MPVVGNRGVRIHYRVEGGGEPLVLQHGTGDSLDSWYELGYVAALAERFRLVLIDARGHGASDKPHDPSAYQLALRVSDVIAVLDDLHIPQACYWGYSMGGWIGFGLACHAPTRCRALIIAGAHPFGGSFAAARALIQRGREHGNAIVLAEMERSIGPLWPQYRERLLQADLRALSALAVDREDLSGALSGLTMPCLLCVGQREAIAAQVRAASAMIPRAEFIMLPGADHAGLFVGREAIVPQVIRFLAAIAPAAGSGAT